MKPNEHGVFTDPERIEIFRKKNAYAMVLLVCVDGRHCWGYDAAHSTGMFGGLPCVKTWCNARNDAILAALRVLATMLRDHPSMLREVERQIECLTPKQLDLFGVFA